SASRARTSAMFHSNNPPSDVPTAKRSRVGFQASDQGRLRSSGKVNSGCLVWVSQTVTALPHWAANQRPSELRATTLWGVPPPRSLRGRREKAICPVVISHTSDAPSPLTTDRCLLSG